MPSANEAVPSRAAAPKRYAAVSRRLHTDAVVMERRYNAMRSSELGSRAWQDAGIEFLREGLKRGCMDHLNLLGDMRGPHSALSERATDELFENRDLSDAFIARLRIAAAREPDLDRGLRSWFGDRLFTGPLSNAHHAHPDHDPTPAPSGRSASPVAPASTLPQLSLGFA